MKPGRGRPTGRRSAYCVEVCGEGAYRGVRVDFRGDSVEGVEARGPFSDVSGARSQFGELGWTPRDPVALVLPRRDGLVRRVRVPSKDPRQIALMVPYEAGTHLPWPAEQALVGYEVYGDDSDFTQLVLVAVQKALVEDHVERLRGFGIEVVRVELSTLSLSRLVRRGGDPARDLAILDIQPHGTEYLRVSGGVPVFSRGAGLDEPPDEMLSRSYGLDRRKSGAESSCDGLLIASDEPAASAAARRAEGLGFSLQPLSTLGLGNGFSAACRPALTAVGAALGLREGASTADLLPERAARRLALRRVARESRVLAAALVWLAAVLYGLGAHYLGVERDRAQRDRAQIEALGAEAQALQEQFEQLEQLAGEREEVSYPLRVVLELYERTPSDVVINEFTYDGRGAVTLGGEAPSYPALFTYLASLGESKLLHDVEMVHSATPRTGGGSRIDFKVNCSLGARGGPKR